MLAAFGGFAAVRGICPGGTPRNPPMRGPRAAQEGAGNE